MTFEEEYDAGYKRAIASMEREMDRLIQEVYGLKQENAALKLEIGRLEAAEMDRYEQDRIWSKTNKE